MINVSQSSVTDTKVPTQGVGTVFSQPRSRWLGFLLGCIGWAVAPLPAQSAERVYISYSILERSIPVSSLEAYALNGTIDRNLAAYARYADPEQLKQLRTALVARAELSPVAISQFLYSPQGEILLQRLGQVIQSESRISGFSGIRAALILASADPEGLTLLNVLRKFPTRGLRIDVERSLEIVSSLEKVVTQTNQASRALQAQSATEASAEKAIVPNQFMDLRQKGPFTWEKQTLTFLDLNRPVVSSPAAAKEPLRGRIFPVDIYLPIARSAQASKPLPVVVISHGLGSDRESFAYLAQHLASYGFAILVPEHPGSNAKQLKALINGTASEIAEPAEFVNRPLDVTYLLNQIASNAAFKGRLNLDAVGVIGQSFGGYTALALGGAPINSPISPECQPHQLENSLNISLLLQCQAFQPGQTGLSLQDQRVKAVIAINPITSAVFGKTGISQIKIPTMIIAGNADTIAPALPEQIQPFTWLNSVNKYLVLMDRGTHFSAIGQSKGDALQIPPEVVGPSPATARRYVSSLSVAFFQTYIANQPSYRSYLSAAYADTISDNLLKLSLIRSFSTDQLTQSINGSGKRGG